MDILSDALFDGSRFRVLTIVNKWSKKCLCLRVGKSSKVTKDLSRPENSQIIHMLNRSKESSEISACRPSGSFPLDKRNRSPIDALGIQSRGTTQFVGRHYTGRIHYLRLTAEQGGGHNYQKQYHD
jgi:hypothetical protein